MNLSRGGRDFVDFLKLFLMSQKSLLDNYLLVRWQDQEYKREMLWRYHAALAGLAKAANDIHAFMHS